MEYQLSIALVTRNRTESLERTLLSLRAQSIQPFEVIISDDSENLDIIVANKNIADRYSCNYVSGPKKGLYANRNFVASICSGSHIRTMDDDHEFPENHILECIRAIKKEESVIWTIGEFSADVMERSLPAPIPGQLHSKGYSYAPSKHDTYYGISCGASIYPRTVIDKKILNLDLYKFGILYLEYGLRLSAKGFQIKNLKSTYVIHHDHEVNDSIATMKSRSSLEIIGGAKVLSMLMLSFYYKKTFINQANTTLQIVSDILMGSYSIKTVKIAVKFFRDAVKII